MNHFSPFCFLILILIILLFILYFGKHIFKKYGKKNLVKEEFNSINPPLFKTAYYPLIVEAKDVAELYKVQEINPYNGYSLYDVDNYPNIVLKSQVIGCGGRRQPCYGGSEQVINNIMPPLEISEKSISPNNIIVGPTKNIKKIGSLYKVFGAQNDILPLYMRTKKRLYEKYFYFTYDKNNNKLKVKSPNVFQSLGTNDQVTIRGLDGKYRVTINDDRIPEYPRIE